MLENTEGEVVRVEGVEPPHLAVLDPKSSASANSATLALIWWAVRESNPRPDD